MVFVADQRDNEILGFSTTSNGNVAPVSVIGGSNTTLSNNGEGGLQLAFDGIGSLYAAVNTNTTTPNSVSIFPTGATGNVPPSGMLTPPYQNSNEDYGHLSFDPAGHLFYIEGSMIEIFAKGAMGSATPIGTISGSATTLDTAEASAVDSSGTLYVVNRVGTSTASFEILMFANAATATGNVAPTAVLSGTNTMLSQPNALAIDSTGRLIVADGHSGILTFAKGAMGNVAPVGVIAGSTTDIAYPTGVAVDGSGDIWECDVDAGTAQILEFAAGSNGNVPPIAQIAGSATTLEYAAEIVFVPGADVQQSTRRRPLAMRPIRR